MISTFVKKDEDLEKETLALAEKIAHHSGEALGLGKSTFYKQKSLDDIT